MTRTWKVSWLALYPITFAPALLFVAALSLTGSGLARTTLAGLGLLASAYALALRSSRISIDQTTIELRCPFRNWSLQINDIGRVDKLSGDRVTGLSLVKSPVERYRFGLTNFKDSPALAAELLNRLPPDLISSEAKTLLEEIARSAQRKRTPSD